MKSIRKVVAAGLVGGALVLTSACGGGGGTGGTGGGTAAKAELGADGTAGVPSSAAPAGGQTPAAPAAGGAAATAAAPKVSQAVVDIQPKSGAVDVAPDGSLKVAVSGGKLTTVKVSDRTGKEVTGTLAADGASWSPTGPLAVGTAYQVSALAADAGGVVAAADSSFTTLMPERESKVSDNVQDNATYGVGMIVSVTFDKDVKNKEAVARGITFDTDNGTVLKGHWFGNRRLDFRPDKYWTPGTKVTVKYRLKSVEIAPGVYGGLDRDEPFTIGRSQISSVDAKTHRMTVVRDGQSSVVEITSGSPEHPTWNGTMVVMSKEGVVRMQSRTLPGMTGAPYDLQAPHSMRLTDTGTYVHGNYWSNAFGADNVSHGCVGLKDVEGGAAGTSAGKFYDGSLIGDVVTVQNSSRGQVAPDNGLGGWNVDWSAW
ncbi:Ig-like domain-containing protein [Kitasatospora purpeofusca]|nr:Ig-like domain-containing protein [Kitasatospora purpeofusca]MDY0810473.1 Ig-like domain-containing protein [Kitasatospora purpeofusca]